MRLYKVASAGEHSATKAIEREAFQDEASLESVLHATPQLILDESLLIIGRQVRLNAGVPDIIALDQFGNIVVCEVKAGRSGMGSASEETILSQPQVYASALEDFAYHDLDDLYADYRDRLAQCEWDFEPTHESPGSLQEAVETTFGHELKAHEFNSEQRIVIVAEEITDATATHSRYLLQKGLHFQCTEIQRFAAQDSTDEQSFILSNTVVDYELERVRPESRPSPTYPDLIADIITPIFPKLRETVGADTPADVFPDGFDRRGARLITQHRAHPDGVIYYVSPEPDADRVTIGLHNRNESSTVYERIHEEADRFTDAGLTVKDNQRYNLVWQRWTVDTVADVRSLQPEISEQYETLVRLGHEVLTEGAGPEHSPRN